VSKKQEYYPTGAAESWSYQHFIHNVGFAGVSKTRAIDFRIVSFYWLKVSQSI